MNQARTEENKKTLKQYMLVAVMMFGFGFALWPIYNVFCEITGLNGKTNQSQTRSMEAMQADFNPDRWVKISFDATVNSQLNWSFRPKEFEIQARPGELTEFYYVAKNLSDKAIVGNAVPSVAPGKASLYFNKTECFCFTEQLLLPGEEKEMLVRFIIDPLMPDDISVLTLSYAVYKNQEATTAYIKGKDATKSEINRTGVEGSS